MKKQSIRMEWILQYLKERPRESVNTLDKFFVDDYCIENEVLCMVQMFGSPKCPQLAKDLKKLYDTNKLTRFACGTFTGASSMGFPKWVWDYRLKE